MAPHLIGILLALSACRSADPPSEPLLEATGTPLTVSQRDSLPERFVGLVIRPQSASLVGVSVERRDLELDSELGPMLFGAVLGELDPTTPLVLAVDRSTEPALTQAAVDSARSVGFLTILGLSYGDGVSRTSPPAELGALYAHPSDPRLYSSFGAALEAAEGPVSVGPGLLSIHGERAVRQVQVDRAAHSDLSPFVLDLLEAMLGVDPEHPAVPWLATAATLGGVPLDHLTLPTAAVEVASADAARHRQQHRPVGLWSTRADLSAAYQQRLWLEQPLSAEVQSGLAPLLSGDPSRLARLGKLRAEHALWHGPSALPAPIGSELGSLLGSPRPVRPDPTGSLAERLAWADPAPTPPPEISPTVVPLGTPSPPVVLRVLPATEHYTRSAEVYAWLAAQVEAPQYQVALARISRAYTAAATGDAGALAPFLDSTDVRLAEPVGWSARDRPTLHLVLGVSLYRLPSGTQLSLQRRELPAKHLLNTADLRHRLDERPRASTLDHSP